MSEQPSNAGNATFGTSNMTWARFLSLALYYGWKPKGTPAAPGWEAGKLRLPIAFSRQGGFRREGNG